MRVDRDSLLAWISADARVGAIEAELKEQGLTLGPSAVWGRDESVRHWALSRHALRLNPALGRVEELVSAFAYEWHGVPFRTISAPREACGPELRTLLYGAPSAVREIELRLLPAHEERWLRLAGKDAESTHRCLREMLVHGVFFRAVWTELATGYVSLCGRMAQVHASLASDIAQDLGVEAQPAQPPAAFTMMKTAAPRMKSWPQLGARDALIIADPWGAWVAE